MPEYNEIVGAPLSPEQKMPTDEEMREQSEKSARDAGVVIIDLNPYTQHVKSDGGRNSLYYRRRSDYWHLPDDGNLGRRAAKETKFAELLATEKQIALKITNPIDFVNSDNGFVRSFLRAGLKSVQLSVMAHKLVITENPNGYDLDYAINTFIKTETARLKKKAAKDAKKAAEEDMENWFGPISFFVPEISTNLKLAEDWTFELYGEYRNDKMLDLVGVQHQGRWSPEGGWKHAPATIKYGATLTVDRIYIRKGAGDYSSLTFWLGKGAVVTYQGTKYTSTKRIRFWAKLADVNKIRALVSKVTVPGM